MVLNSSIYACCKLWLECKTNPCISRFSYIICHEIGPMEAVKKDIVEVAKSAQLVLDIAHV